MRSSLPDLIDQSGLRQLSAWGVDTQQFAYWPRNVMSRSVFIQDTQRKI